MASLMVNKLLFHLSPMPGVYRSYHAAQKPLTRIPSIMIDSVIARRNHSCPAANASWRGTIQFLTAGLAGCALLTYLAAKALNLSSVAQATEKSAEEIEAEAIAEKDGEMGKCIGRTPDEFGGYIYHFEIRGELAVDPFTKMVFEDLGYRWDKNKLSVPDSVALKARFTKQIEKKWQHLKPLKIFDYSGDLDDQTSLKAFLTHDFTLSEGRGFLRDHLSIIPLIYLMSKNERYYDEQALARESVKSLVNRLKLAKEYFQKMQYNTGVLSELKTAIRITIEKMRVEEAFELVTHDLDKMTKNGLLIKYRGRGEDYFDDCFFDKAGIEPYIDYEFLDKLNTEETNRLWQRKYGREFNIRRLSKAWEICAAIDVW